jgi:5-methylcytosine-specific restriction endonuclease McrA
MGKCQSKVIDVVKDKQNVTKKSSSNRKQSHKSDSESESDSKFNKVIDIDKKYKKGSIPKAVKRSVWDKWVGKDIGTTKCLCCKHQEIRQIEFHCGHILAEKNGGDTNVNNLMPICAQCNLSMGTMNIKEFQKLYFSK